MLSTPLENPGAFLCPAFAFSWGAIESEDESKGEMLKTISKTILTGFYRLKKIIKNILDIKN